MNGREIKLSWSKSLLIIFFFFYPLLFMPLWSDGYSLIKLLFFALMTLLIVFTWLWVNKAHSRFQLSLSPLLGGMLGLVVAAWLAAVVASPNFHFSVLVLPIPLLLAFLFLVAFISYYKEDAVSLVLTTMLASAFVLALIAIYQYFGVFSSFVKWPLLKSKVWTPLGSSLDLIFYLSLMFIVSFVLAWVVKNQLKKLLYFFLSLVILAGDILTAVLIFGRGSYHLNFLPWKTAWSITLEVVKNYPLFGVGPGMFLTAFERFRDVSYNATKFWSQQFVVSRNTPLHLTTELGLVGFLSWLFFWWLVLKTVKDNWLRSQESILSRLLSFLLILTFAYQLFFTASVFVWLVTLVLVGLYVLSLNEVKKGFGLQKLILVLEATKKDESRVATYKSSTILNWMVLIVFLSLIGYTSWFLLPYARAEEEYYLAMKAGRNNQARELLNHLGKAINSYPWISRYQLQLARIHLNIINNILSKKPKEITDKDRQQLQASVQVALERTKIVASRINPLDANNWVSLANVYRQIVGIAKGAAQWELASYRQAVALDPVNPVLRTTLAGLLYSLNDLDGAIEQAKLAVQAKPDYANGWYNLALAYEKKGEYKKALTAMNKVLAVLPADSPDRSKAEAKLKELKDKVGQNNKQQTTNQKEGKNKKIKPTPTPVLHEPSPLPTPTLSPVPLPAEKIKPPISPTPTP